MSLRRIPWLIAGIACGCVVGLCCYAAFFLDHPKGPRYRSELVMIGAAIGFVLGVAADIIVRRH